MVAATSMGTLQNGLLQGPVQIPKSMSVQDHQSLCFNKAHFSRSDFSVERFLGLARRRATLDQLHNDLRAYLRILQNSMVELINDDYTEFVSLSSSLAALKESIDKISSDFSTLWTSFETSTADIQKTAEAIDHRCEELAHNRREQVQTRNKLSLLLSLQRLSGSIHRRPAELSDKWLARFAHDIAEAEVLSSRIGENKVPQKAVLAKEACFAQAREILTSTLISGLRGEFRHVALILSILSLMGETEMAISRVVDDVICKAVELANAEPYVGLKNLYASVTSMRSRWTERSVKASQNTAEVEFFINASLLRFVSNVLEERFRFILVPSDNRTFHLCYVLTEEFVRQWPNHKDFRAFLKEIKSKFNTVVYAKLETQPLMQAINDAMQDATATSAGDEKHGRFKCRFLPSSSVLSAIDRLYSDEVYLHGVIDKFWDFTLKILSEYAEWLSTFSSRFQTDEEGSPKWLALVNLTSDVAYFDGKLFDLCLTKVWEQLKLSKTDPTPFGQCLTLFSQELARKRADMVGVIRSDLIDRVGKALEGVHDIPRQYRWTKRPMPTTHSEYLLTAFADLDAFLKEVEAAEWTEEQATSISTAVAQRAVDVFTEKAVQVLESVEQTGSSLQRFKRKGAVQDGSGAQAETDEAKIRRQLFFDTAFVKDKVKSHGVVDQKLDEITARTSAE
ncbi:Protein COGC-2 [Aphelenchoides avenae]|nr:Protein COGC-2 [Aphelenchus avenae]